jgi:hypothetical protein
MWRARCRNPWLLRPRVASRLRSRKLVARLFRHLNSSTSIIAIPGFTNVSQSSCSTERDSCLPDLPRGPGLPGHLRRGALLALLSDLMRDRVCLTLISFRLELASTHFSRTVTRLVPLQRWALWPLSDGIGRRRVAVDVRGWRSRFGDALARANQSVCWYTVSRGRTNGFLQVSSEPRSADSCHVAVLAMRIDEFARLSAAPDTTTTSQRPFRDVVHHTSTRP